MFGKKVDMEHYTSYSGIRMLQCSKFTVETTLSMLHFDGAELTEVSTQYVA